MPLQLPDEQPSHQVEFMDAQDTIIFETVVYNADSFCQAIDLAMVDADTLNTDVSQTDWVSVRRYKPA